MTIQALTIAGSDSGGGAGIQADLKTFQQRKVFGTSVITALTAQNTKGVYDIHIAPHQSVEKQIEAIADDFAIGAFKIGMLGNKEMIQCVSNSLSNKKLGMCVVDPVMVAKGGQSLLDPQATSALIEYILPLADVITPNIPEAEALTQMKINTQEDIFTAAKKIQSHGIKCVIIKGGHVVNDSQYCTDSVLINQTITTLKAPRFKTKETHGTGCTFSACLTAELAKGNDILTAVKTAKAFITDAISHPLNIGHGNGPTNHWAYQDSQ